MLLRFGAAGLIAVSGNCASVYAWQPAEGAEVASAPQPVPDARIRFNFNEAPFAQVLDFFARETGLPVIREANVPGASMTFIGAEAYTLDDAITILNLNLQMHGVQLRREANFLYLSTLQDAARRATRVGQEVPSDARPEEILSYTLPLNNAVAKGVGEQIKPLLSPFGSVTAVDAQNLLVIVDTAAQCSRIGDIVREIDQIRPVDSSYRLFPLRYAQAKTVVEALKGLVGERQKTVVIDKDGQQRVVEEVSVAGLNIQADQRTNSVIVVGAASRIETVEELIALLDRPEDAALGGEPEMATFVLSSITPQRAAEGINALFQGVPKNRQPVMIPLPEQGKLAIVAAPMQLAQARALLGELDPDAGRGEGGVKIDRVARSISLEHARFDAIQGTLQRLMSERQSASVRFAGNPDGRGLVLVGPAADVEQVSSLITSLDSPAGASRDARVVRLPASDPDAALARARELLTQSLGSDPDVSITHDPGSGVATIVGPRDTLDRFDAILRTAEAGMVVELTSKEYTLTQARPSAIASTLARLADSMLRPGDGRSFTPPGVQAVDELGVLIVRASPEQLVVVDELVSRLDRTAPEGRDFRVLDLRASDPEALLARARSVFASETKGLPEAMARAPEATFDAASGKLVLAGPAEGVRRFADVVERVRQLDPPARTTRIIDVQYARAEDIEKPLRELLDAADPIDAHRQVPEATIAVVERTNSLVVTAEPAQHEMIRDLVSRLDQVDPSALPPLRLLQLRAADAPAIAQMLTDQYARRPQADRLARPVQVRADAGTNTLIVSAHAELFDDIRAFVEDINKERGDGPERVTVLLPLKLAKAVDVAAAMDRLYPEPPMPLDRRGQPLPHLRREKEVRVSAEASSNSLIIDAPADRLDSLQELASKLDRVELPPVAELRTYRIVGADLGAVARTLSALSRQGTLSAPAQPGKPAVNVLIETEPRSGTLIVAGDQTTFERVESILKDLEAVPIERPLRIVPVANVDAETLKTRAEEIYAAQIASIPDAGQVDVSVDGETNSLMIVADEEASTRFLKIVDELQRQAGPAREIRLIELRLADVSTVIGFLRDLAGSSASLRMQAGPEPMFEAIEQTNTLMVAATPAQMPIIEQLVRSLDNRQGGEQPPLRILRLRSTDAASLASVLQQAYARRAPDERTRKPVDVQADAATNTLVVSAHPDVLPEIERVVRELNDAQSLDEEGREIRIFPLKIARAEELARTIDQMYPEPPMPLDPRTRQPRPDLQRPREVVVRADRVTNALIVDAPARRMSGFAQLVESLDQQNVPEGVEVRTYTLVRTTPSSVMNAVMGVGRSDALPGLARTPLNAFGDDRTGSLIVSGPAEAFPLVEDLLAKLDAPPEAPPVVMRVYALQHARAERIQPTVDRLLRAQAEQRRQREGTAFSSGDLVVEVAADRASNVLLISVPEPLQVTAKEVVGALDVASASDAGTMTRVVPLTYAKADEVARTARDAARTSSLIDEASLQTLAVAGSNAVVIVGAQADVTRVAAIIESMDVRPNDAQSVGVRTIALTHARAETLAPLVERLLQQDSVLDLVPEWTRWQLVTRGEGVGPKTRVVADARTNALIVSGPTGSLELAEQIVRTLDASAEDGAASRSVRVISVNNGDANAIAESVRGVIADLPASGAPAVLRVDAGSNAILAAASPAQMAEIERLVRELDAAAVMSTRQLRTIPIDRSRAEAELMARTLKRLLESREGVRVNVVGLEDLVDHPTSDSGTSEAPARGSPGSSVVPVGVGGLQGLIGAAIANAATAQAVPMVGVIALVEQPADSAASGAHDAPPAAMSEEASGDAGTEVTIAVDPATNSLVVLGSDRILDRIATLARDLASSLPAEPTEVHIVPLPAGVDAAGLRAVIDQTVRQVGRVGASNPGGFTANVSVGIDPTESALIVWANESDFRAIGPLIASLATLEPSVSSSVRLFPLVHVRSQDARSAIEDLLSDAPRGRQARRLRAVDLTIESRAGGPESGEGGTLRASVRPGEVRIVETPGGTGLIVAAPEEAMGLVDRFVAMIDQNPATDRLTIKRYELAHADAAEIARALETVLEAQRQGGRAQSSPRARLVPDARTNSVLVTATPDQHEQIDALLASADVESGDADLTLAIIPMQRSQPTTAARIVEQAMVGSDPARKQRVRVTPDDDSGVLVVRASEEDLAEVREILAEVDRAGAGVLPVRTIALERADAGRVAQAINQLYQQRAQASRSRRGSGIAVVGDKRTGTLVVAASDADFEDISSLAQSFDAKQAAGNLQYVVVPLENASVTDVAPMLQSLMWDLQYDRNSRARGGLETDEDRFFIQPDARTNSLIVLGEGEALQTLRQIVTDLDRPKAEAQALAVRVVRAPGADLDAIAQVVTEMTTRAEWEWWRGRDPEAVQARPDRRRQAIVLIGRKDRIDEASSYVEQLAGTGEDGDREIASIRLEHAAADRAAQSLSRFFQERAQAEGLPRDNVSIVGSREGNVLIVAADTDAMKLLRQLVEEIDQPELSNDRRRELFALRNASAQDVSRTISLVFPRAQRPEERVIVVPIAGSTSLLVSAPSDTFAEIEGLIAKLDAPPTAEQANIVTARLENARAGEIAQALRGALPAGVKVDITPVERTNSLLLTGSNEAIALVMEQVKALDAEPTRGISVVRRVRLEHAAASDITLTVQRLLRARPQRPGEPRPEVDDLINENTIVISAAADQVDELERMIKELDVKPEEARKTEFVRLEFADAEQTAKALQVFYGRYAFEAATPEARFVTIVPDPASNSLVISASEGEWEGIVALLRKLDTQEYDTSRQLVVIPLVHADAPSIARSLSEGFRAPLEQQLQQERVRLEAERRNRGNQGTSLEPTVLLEAGETPVVSAESVTNALIVFAQPRDLERIRAIVEQLDVPEFARLPRPSLIPLRSGRASAVAATVREMFAGRARSGARSLLVYGDDASNTVIVRAPEEDFAQIAALVESMQQEGDRTRAAPSVVRLKNVPAMRLRTTLLAALQPLAQQRGQALAIEVDRGSNALVVSASEEMLGEVKGLVAELDRAPDAPLDGAGDEPVVGLGQSLRIVDLAHASPEEMRQTLEQLGVTRPQPADRPGLVSEPLGIVTLKSRRALALSGTAPDVDAVASLVRTLDAEPGIPAESMRVVQLRLATAEPLAATLRRMLDPAQQDAQTGPARAIAEQVRRLSLVQSGLDAPDLALDLSRPIRILADQQTNSIILASSEANLAALEEVTRLLDTLPVGDAVLVRIFPLTNAAAPRVRGVIEQLFTQGEAIRRLPGTQRRGLPSTATGQALAGEIAISVDERTNALVVAGREEAIALVEVLIKDLDAEGASNWVEPTIIPLAHADARTLATTLTDVLVRGLGETPEATALQRQVGRLRVANAGGGDNKGTITADIFAPLSGLIIRGEDTLNALIVVGSRSNIEVVRALTQQLDVERASASNTVRVFPLEHAAADRVASIVGSLLRERGEAEGWRPEDRLVVSVDSRTNAIIASTSERTFGILDSLLKTLDREDANVTVGLHVVPVVGGDVRQLAPRIERLMRERISAARRAGAADSPMDAFSIEPEAGTNALIVAASDENLKVIQDLVRTLTDGAEALGAAEQVALVTLESMPAAQAAQTVREVYADKENERRGARAVGVVPDDRLNALIVSGTSSDVDAIRGIVQRLEHAESAAVQDVRRIELSIANALEVSRLIEGVLAGRTLAGTNDSISARQRTLVRYMEREATIDAQVRERIRLTPDLRTNSVMVAAPPEAMDLVEMMIRDLDSSSAGARQIERFKLVNADARQAAEVLRDLFNLQQAGGRLVLMPVANAEQTPAPAERLLEPVRDERQELSITIDIRTNALWVSGTPEYLALVRDVVSDLDKDPGAARERMVYRLKNARAKEVETTLQAYFSGEADTLRATLGPASAGSLVSQLEQEVTVVGDEKSNTLVISASPRYIETVAQIVEELDAAPPQVMIQVLLAEVTIDDEDTWGADVEVGPIGGNGWRFSSAPAGGSVATALGVGNLSVSTNDFSLIVRSLEVQGRLEVLSRPQVTVKNNEEASIQVGEDIAIVESVDTFDNGRTQANVVRQDLGIILEVTPTISSDGYVSMKIKPEISSLSNRTTQISEDFQAPIITRRTVDTTVTVRDGQTVVIGGLIQTSQQERTTKMPIIGDIPILGLPFRTSLRRDVKTELLVILTPHVIPGDAPAGPMIHGLLTDNEIDRMTSGVLLRNSINSPGGVPLEEDQEEKKEVIEESHDE
jgi:type II secretion system protein D